MQEGESQSENHRGRPGGGQPSTGTSRVGRLLANRLLSNIERVSRLRLITKALNLTRNHLFPGAHFEAPPDLGGHPREFGRRACGHAAHQLNDVVEAVGPGDRGNLAI